MDHEVVRFTFRTSPMVCSDTMTLAIKGNVIQSLEVVGGCPGNLQGISRLVKGMEVDEVIRRLEGISCGGKPTSCPDQLAQALKEYRQKYLQNA